MKKQGGIYLKVVFGVLGVFFAAMLLLRVFTTQSRQLQTETAVLYEVGDGITTSGFVVRDEHVLTQTNSLLTLQCREGEWIGAGQTVALSHTSEAARADQIKRESLSAELEQLEYAYTYATSNADAAPLDDNIEQQITALSAGVAKRDLTAAARSAETLKTYILRRDTGQDDSQTLLQRITELRTQLEALGSGQTGSGTIAAPCAGYFSANVDGLEEQLTPEWLQTMRAADLDALQMPSAPTNAVGKLITSNSWYYVTAVETAQLEGREVGEQVTVRFSYQLKQDVPMQIARIGQDEDGRSLLVLTTNTHVFDTTALRQQTADVIFQTYRGLRIPKQGLYTDEEGNAGVYVLEGATAEWKQVEIIRDNDDSYIVTLSQDSTDGLWPGDEIILTSEEIYNGKVVQQ